MDQRNLPVTPPAVQKGDRLLYATHTGSVRYVLVVGTAIESNGFPVFDGVCLDGPMRGKIVWGYFDQVSAVEPRIVPMVVTFRARCGAVLDRVRVSARTDGEAIASARAVAIAAAQLNDRAAPDLDNPTVGVDLNALERR